MGSALWLEAVKDKKISKNTLHTYADSNKNLGILSYDDILKYMEIGHKRFYFRPKYIANQIFKSLKRGDINTVLHGLSLQTNFLK